MKKSMYFNYTSDLPIAEKAAIIAEAGFDGTELFCYRDPQRETLAEQYGAACTAGLSVHAYHAAFSKINSIWEAGDEGEALCAFLERSVTEASALGIGVAVVHLSSGNTPPAYNELGLSRYARLVELGKKNGVRIAFENLRRTEYLDFVLDNLPDAGFCFDCGHEKLYNGGYGVLEKHADRLLCMHLHDNNGSEDNHFVPFDGSIDWSRLCARLKAVRPDCPLTFEALCREGDSRAFPERLMERAQRLEALLKQ